MRQKNGVSSIQSATNRSSNRLQARACIPRYYRSTQPCIPPGSLNRVPALCDPMWHVSSRSGVATLRTAIHLLLTYLLTYYCCGRYSAPHYGARWPAEQHQQLLVALCMDDHRRPVRVSWCEHSARHTQPVNALDEMSARRTSVSADRPLPASRRPEITRCVEI